MTQEIGLKRKVRGRGMSRLRRRRRAGRYVNYRPRFLRLVLTVFLRIAIWITMRLRIVDLHNLPKSGGCIVMINHIAFLDPVIVSGTFPRTVISMAKMEAYTGKILGPLIRTFDAFPVSRGDVDRKALMAAFEVLDNGLPLLIAPEGTRSQVASLGEAHHGLAYVASQAGVPIVPIAISGSDQWKHNVKRFIRTPVTVRVGRPFFLDAGDDRLGSESLKQMTDEAMYQLAACLPPEQRGIYSNLGAATTRYLRFVSGDNLAH